MSIEDQIQSKYKQSYKREVANASLECGRAYAASLHITQKNRDRAVDECYMHMLQNYQGPKYGLLAPVFFLVLRVVLYWLAQKIIDEILDRQA